MKRNYLIAGSITLFISAVVLMLWLIQPYSSFFDSITTSKHYLDVSKDITLNFEGAYVSVNEWGKNYVEVTYDNIFGKKKRLDISTEGNMLTLNSSLDFSGYKHMDIKVPKAVIRINADRIDVKNVTVRSVKANKGSFRYCTMLDGFISEGRELKIRESRLMGNGIIKNEVVDIRECDGEDVILSSDNHEKRINAHLRDLTGNSVKLDAKSCNSLFVELKDVSLNKLTVDYAGNDGKITVFRGLIVEVENNSKINIEYKKNVFR